MLRGVPSGPNDPDEQQSPVAFVIEDDAASRDLVCACLESMGFQTEALQPSLKAIEKGVASAVARDVVVIDVMLGPACDGFDVVRMLADRRFAGRVVVMSGYRTDYLNLVHSMADAFRLRIAGALEKPVTISTLQQLLADPSV